MYNLVRNFPKMRKHPPQCACLSALKQPKPLEKPENPPEENKQSPKELAPVKMALTPKPPHTFDQKLVLKEDMQWRTPWHQNEGPYYTTLKTFSSDDNQLNLMKLLQSPINFSPAAIKKWWAKKKEYKEIMMQSYLPERNQMLGNELAAAHFTVFRKGAVKFHGQDKWIRSNKYDEYDLPRFYESDKILEAIDCSDMNLYYEGLSNFRNLKQVEWLSLNGVEQVDDWFLDKISNLFSHSLIYLDLRDCPKYTYRGLGALYKMNKLKILLIDDMLMTTNFEMTCLMLQDVNPHLDIRIGDSS